MDDALAKRLNQGAGALGISLPEGAVAPLLRHVELLLKWNRSINLTAVTDPAEVVEKHVLDSLAAAAFVPAGHLLDAGTGGGFPGIPIRLVRPDVEVTLVDSVGKKVAFLKNVIADLRLTGVQAVATRLGAPAARAATRLGPFDAAVARAFSAPEEWLTLALGYVHPGGTILCLAGPRDDLPERAGRATLLKIEELRLPFSGAVRRIGVYRVDREGG